MDIIYLDYDGVTHPGEVYVHSTEPKIRLHAKGYTLFENAPFLEEALAPYPNLNIVLSTSWVPSFGFAYARDQLIPSLRKRVCGGTYDPNDPMAWRFARRTRYDQILGDVNRRRPDRWLALDDDALGWPQKELGHLVLVPAEFGLWSDLARSELKARLAVQFEDVRPKVKLTGAIK
jgi:HAD domain in Swiss Army Knife RNA repair proteins